MDIVFEELAKEHPVTQFLRVSLVLETLQLSNRTHKQAEYDGVSLKFVLVQVEAEELSDISEEYGVTAVPFFAILKVISDRISMTHVCAWILLLLHVVPTACIPEVRFRESVSAGRCKLCSSVRSGICQAVCRMTKWLTR